MNEDNLSHSHHKGESIMDNKQALGYMLLACKEAGLDHETTKQLYKEMYYQFDVKTESEAENLGFRWYQEQQPE